MIDRQMMFTLALCELALEYGRARRHEMPRRASAALIADVFRRLREAP